MNSVRTRQTDPTRAAAAIPAGKAPTGIPGFDEITRGGLPRGRSTLIMGGPGAGKTVFALQFLAYGARSCGEPGVFVAFEEAPKRIVANFESFGWKLGVLQPRKLFLIDAQPTPDLIHSGGFDFGGLLASVGAKVSQIGARRIVFDALDVLLALLPDAAAVRREMYRLHDWLLAHDLTALITAKAGGEDPGRPESQPLGFMQFMVDCAVVLNHRVELGVSRRSLRVQKYRGTGFDENESPFVIGRQGFDVAVSRAIRGDESAAQSPK